MPKFVHKTKSPTVVITGASAGVGRATAVAFAKRGCKVALIARDTERLRRAFDDVERAGGRGLVLPADVADPQAVETAANTAAAEFDGIDVWVNCATASVFSPLSQLTPAEFRRVTEVTYLGYVHGTMAALKHMRPKNHGTIVQVGSALAYRSIPLQSAYCGAKFAIRGFTDALRSELLHERSRIRLSMVQLPAFNTPQFDWSRNKMPRRPKPLGTIFQPELAAQAILRAARYTPRELWVGRSAIKAILGSMVVPGFLDHYLARKAYGGQMAREPASPSDPDNLFAPAQGDFGAHGRFDAKAVDRPPLTMNPATAKVFGVCAAGVILGTLIAALRRPER